MKTYFQDGTSCDVAYFLDDTHEQFYIQDIGNDLDRYMYPGDSLKYDLDAELVNLYDTFRNLLFPDTETYYSQLSLMPIYVQEAGQDSRCALSNDEFNKLVKKQNSEDLNRHLYLVDCQYLVGTIQNLHIGMEDIFVNYFIKISELMPTIPQEDDTLAMMSMQVASLSSSIESYFIKAYSILDMLCKIVYEFENPQTDFTKYKKLKSAKKLWGDKKDLSINGSINTVFETNDIISNIESLRNEVVHNGAWELNPKAYFECSNNTVTKRYIKFPDMSQGRLSSSNCRRHFFSQDKTINEVLPLIHYEFKSMVYNTVALINHRYPL